jgi:hypothetical protein
LYSEYAIGAPYAYSSIFAANFFQNYDNQWTLITVVTDYNNKNAKFYRNGILFYTSTTANNMLFPSSSRIKYIGSYSTGSHFFTGYLDDVRIYNRALTANEISEIYNKTKEKYQ